MRKTIAFTLTALACSTALALNAFLDVPQAAPHGSTHVALALQPDLSPQGINAETDSSRECSVDEGILSDCIFP